MALTKVTNSLVAVNAIQGTLIADNAVTAVHIVNNAITATQLADNAVTATKIQNGIIATDHLAADLITAAKIADDAISEEHLDATVISSLSTVTANSSDYVMIGDSSDSNNLKKALVSDFAQDEESPVFTGNVAINNTSPELFFGTTGNHYNWRIAAQENTSAAFQIDVGSQDTDYSNDSYSSLFTILNTGKIGIGTASPANKLAVNGAISIEAAASAAISEGLLIDYSTNLARFLTYDSSTGSEIAFYTQPNGGSTTQALRIDSSQNSTFAGTISSGDISITSTGPSISLIDSDNNPDYQIKNGNGAFRIIDTTNSLDKINITTSSNVFNVASQGSAFDANDNSTWNALEIFQDRGVTNSGSGIAFRSQSGTSPAGIVSVAGNTTGGIESLAFVTVASNVGVERMRVTSDGKVGIGTTSPAAKLHVQGSGEVNPLMVRSDGNCGISIDTTQTNGDEFAIRSVVNGTQPMLQIQNVDRSVNMININNSSKVHMGIGVVPEADWATDCDVIQLGGLGAWFSKSAQSASSATTLAQNVYDDTSVGQAYIVTDEASSIVLDDGTINFQYASSGSADAAISWNSAIYIDNNGNIGFGTGNPDPWYGMTNRILDVRGGSDNNYGGGIRFSSLNGSWYSTSIRNVQNAMVFASTFDDTVRLTIDATGKVTWPNTASSTTGAGNIAHSSNNWFYVRGGSEGAFLGGSGFTGNIKVAEGANQHEWEVNSADAMTINGSTRVLSGDFNDTSDAALKENITNITGGLSIIKQLQPRNFDWKEASKVDGAAGFIAQEVAAVLPNEVQGTDYSAGTRDEHGVKTGNSMGKTIKLAGILAHAVKAIQELEARVKTLEG